MINIIGNRIGAQKSGGAANQAFEFTVDTTQAGTSAADQFTIPITSATPYNISTSDGHSITGATGATTLTFSAPGTYTVSITESCEGWRFNNGGDKLKLLDIKNWGVYANTATNSFYGASNMTCSAVDKPTGIHTTLNGAFGRCTLFNGAIGNWDVSTVTNMAFMFDHLFSTDGEFNQDISSWDVSNVITFQRMFTNCKFNQDISSWTIKNTGAVNMQYMFSASFFNQPLNDWDMTAVADMSYMFNDNRVFNQDLNLWNTNGCANMASMFRLSAAFNGDISTWNTSNVTNMSEMFNSCNFNGDVSAWDTSSVTNMSFMFRYCPMNSNISGWNVGNVTNMSNMFYGAPNFNQPIGLWDVSSVTNFGSTFAGATSFDQDLSSWTFSPLLQGLGYTFQNATSFNNGGQPLTWNVSNFTQMDSTFYAASSFNADISSWAGNTISNWNQTFRLSGLNQNINSIITSSTTNLRYTFRDANSFNNAGVPLNLNTSNVTNMQYMFGGAALVNQISGLDSFEVENVSFGDGFIQSPRALTTANYDALLVSWESKLQVLYPGGVGYVNTPTFAFGLSTYTLGSAAETARTSLINTYGWTITDGGGISLPFIFTVENTFNSNPLSFTIPADTATYTYNYNVSTSDGQNFTNQTGPLALTFAGVGPYDITVSGTYPSMRFGTNPGNGNKIVDIKQFGSNTWQDFEDMFAYSLLSVVTATDTPNLSAVTSLKNCFKNATSYNDPKLNNWDVSTITTFETFLWNAGPVIYGSFNQDLSSWDVSSANTFYFMFDGCPMNQSFAAWNVTSLGTTNPTTAGTEFISPDTSQTPKMSTANYDATLISWASQSVQSGVRVDFRAAQYTLGGAAEAARNTLVTTYGWTINDGGGI